MGMEAREASMFQKYKVLFQPYKLSLKNCTKQHGVWPLCMPHGIGSGWCTHMNYIPLALSSANERAAKVMSQMTSSPECCNLIGRAAGQWQIVQCHTTQHQMDWHNWQCWQWCQHNNNTEHNNNKQQKQNGRHAAHPNQWNPNKTN